MAGLGSCGPLALVLPFLLPFLGAIADETCSGHAEEFGGCPDLLPCSDCTPVDCKFGDWGEWYEENKCTGVCFRKRNISQHHNECGSPCHGTSIGSKTCLDPGCQSKVDDCTFSQWKAWSSCSASTDQRVRTRLILALASPNGAPCRGDLKETKECGGPSGPLDCLLKPWAPWTTCSATCGVGHMKRSRAVKMHAAAGGKLCSGNLSQVEMCNTQACGGIQDCGMSAWSVWAGCDATNPAQRYRTRTVSSPAMGGGKGCKGYMKETQGCPLSAVVPTNCTMGEWSTWKACSRTCGGGQTFRHRTLEVPPNSGGSCNTSATDETRGCNENPCLPPGPKSGTPCTFNTWELWSPCSHDCGQGTRSRVRTVYGEATGNGDPCKGAINEVESCLGTKLECQPVDCVWGSWEEWSACTKTCGGGSRQRDRFVAIAPVRGGLLCQPWESAQVEACHRPACTPCIDGTWADWGPWSDCSASCSNGTRARHRELGQPPSSCGKPPTGSKDIFEVCQNTACVPDRDCVLSQWADWSSCCPDCYGIRKRTRQIERFATGWGKPCEDSVWETQPCNPGPDGVIPHHCRFMSPPSNCHLSAWSDWSHCTTTCGGGQSGRQRSITSWPDYGGKACMEMPLGETRECGSAPCSARGCVDCLWGAWSDWGHCFKCGDQRERKRMIEKLPNHCGRRCDARSAAETSNCYSECNGKQLLCAWTEWTSYTSCPAHGCGPHITRRHRVLQWNARDVSMENSSKYLFKGSKDAFCAGSESDDQECPYRSCTSKCVPEPCIFGQWTDWGQPLCEGLCERTRLVAKNAICGARPCEGPLTETKPCVASCSLKVDCELSPWTIWSQCQLKHGQKYRTRQITKPTMHGGKTCRGPLQDTMPCWWSAPRNECAVGEWGMWSACMKTCGEAVRMRKRHILTPATSGGQGCIDALEEITNCNLQACGANQVAVANCILNAWTPWKCGSDGLESRDRDVQVPAANGGQACDGPLKEVRPCPPVDCEVSTWSQWATCDKTCDGGTRTRQRQFDHLPKFGGKPCFEALSMHEIEPCSQAPCHPEVDCAVDIWVSWSACSITCGEGQRSRERKVAHPRKDNGLGCNLPLTQTQPCSVSGCAVVDCDWGDWSPWSMCTLTCGGGEQSRNRDIAVAPSKGGKPCDPIPKAELRPCNTDRCAEGGCIDGAWGDWSVWGACSSSCNGGISWRSRSVQTLANWCGDPAVGPDKEYGSCNAAVSCGDVNCSFSGWSNWNACTKGCNGVQRRTRAIAQAARGKGLACNGTLEETGPCNPRVGEQKPAGCTDGAVEYTTCTFSDWTAGGCSATCGGGRTQKSRLTRLASTQDASTATNCSGAISVVEPCNAQVCPQDVVTPCKWGDWTSWGECNKCGGQRKRHRQILQMPANGAVCSVEASEEIGKCARSCDGYAPGSYCQWQPWATWGSCDSSCGRGRRSRRRELNMTVGGDLPASVAMLMGMARLYEEGRALPAKNAEELEHSRRQELVVAFAGGWASLGAALFALHRLCRRRSPSDTTPLE